MTVALDTNRYVDLCKGVAETVALVEEAERVFLPFVVIAELRAGFAHGRRQADNERTLRRFLLKPGVTVVFADDQTTHHYAAVFKQLRRHHLQDLGGGHHRDDQQASDENGDDRAKVHACFT